jgi:hypothetical protein
MFAFTTMLEQVNAFMDAKINPWDPALRKYAYKKIGTLETERSERKWFVAKLERLTLRELHTLNSKVICVCKLWMKA